MIEKRPVTEARPVHSERRSCTAMASSCPARNSPEKSGTVPTTKSINDSIAASRVVRQTSLMGRGSLYLVAVLGIATGAFFFGRWWEEARYLSPHKDELVIRYFLEPALAEIAKDPRTGELTKAVYRRSKISTLRVAGFSCLTFLPRPDESEWIREVCFTDEGRLVKNEAY